VQLRSVLSILLPSLVYISSALPTPLGVLELSQNDLSSNANATTADGDTLTARNADPKHAAAKRDLDLRSPKRVADGTWTSHREILSGLQLNKTQSPQRDSKRAAAKQDFPERSLKRAAGLPYSTSEEQRN
ncbi:hypothetical protein K443DRAFT_16011, partial [Laccaria amethystina LaAM-08-1]